MKKMLKLLSILGMSTPTLLTIVACTNSNQDIKFNYQNLISAKNIITQTQDNNGNLYYATFDSSNIGIPGEKIWKYNLVTKKAEVYWENKNFKIASFSMVIDIKGNIYLSSAGGVTILNNKHQFSNMPLVSGAITDIIYFKNNVYITSFEGFYQYNIDTKITDKIELPNNLIANSVFIDTNENIYLGIYKSVNCGALMIKKGESEATPLISDDFFNTNNAWLITEINNKLYFYSLNLQNKEAKLYSSDLGSVKVEYLLDLPAAVENIFNLNNKVGLVRYENKNTIIYQILNMKIEKKYEIKNTSYDDIKQNLKNLYFQNENKIDCINW